MTCKWLDAKDRRSDNIWQRGTVETLNLFSPVIPSPLTHAARSSYLVVQSASLHLLTARNPLLSFLENFFPPAVSMCVPVHGAPASASTHPKAAAGAGRLPTRVGKEFVQGGFGPAGSTLSAGEQLQ